MLQDISQQHPDKEAIMTSNFQPSEDTFDDVSAHAYKSGRIDGPDGEDTEGHGFRGNIEATEGEDTEGHGTLRDSIEATDDDDGDDTEGHGVRVRF